MIRLTVFLYITQRCCTKTATSLPMFKTARKRYSGGRTADGNKAKVVLLTVSLTAQKPLEGKSSRDEVFVQKLGANFCLEKASVW